MGTRMEVKASRELDAEVAELLFDGRWLPFGPPGMEFLSVRLPWVVSDRVNIACRDADGLSVNDYCPRFSVIWGSVGRIVDALEARGLSISLDNTTRWTWCARIFLRHGEKPYCERYETTAPLAVCLATVHTLRALASTPTEAR